MKLLLIEDDKELVKQLLKSLKPAGFELDISTNGVDGLYRAKEFVYDLAIVDLGLPEMSGIELIKNIRADKVGLPVLILTARSSWQDKVLGLNSGADDYLVKPFQTEELIARIHAMIRRSGGYTNSELTQGPIIFNLDTHEVKVDEAPVKLTAFETKLLQYFMLHPNKVVSKMILADYLYDEDAETESNVIEVLVARLRQKLDPNNELKPIETLRGRGYRFCQL